MTAPRVALSVPGYWAEITTVGARLSRAMDLGAAGRNREALALVIAAWNVDDDDDEVLPVTAETVGLLAPEDEEAVLRAVRSLVPGWEEGYQQRQQARRQSAQPSRGARRGKRKKR